MSTMIGAVDDPLVICSPQLIARSFHREFTQCVLFGVAQTWLAQYKRWINYSILTWVEEERFGHLDVGKEAPSGQTEVPLGGDDDDYDLGEEEEEGEEARPQKSPRKPTQLQT